MLPWLIPSIISAIGALGSSGVFGGGGNDYDKLVNDILNGNVGGIPPALMAQLASRARSNIQGLAKTQKEQALTQSNAQGLSNSGILQKRYSDIDKYSTQALAESQLGLQMQDTQMRNVLLSQVLGMGNPNAQQNQMWGNMFGQGLNGLMQSFQPQNQGLSNIDWNSIMNLIRYD